MYQFPFLLLTSDDVRNANIADLLEDETADYVQMKRELYSALPNDVFPTKPLHELVELEIIMSKMLCDVFRTNLNVLKTELTGMDNYRIKEKLKRVFTILRRKSADILHHYDEYLFSDTLRKLDLWEDNPVLKTGKPADWNSQFLNRISDIHRHLCRLVVVVEHKLLIKQQQLSPEVDRNKTLFKDDEVIVGNIPKIVETCNIIKKEVKDYLRLVDSL